MIVLGIWWCWIGVGVAAIAAAAGFYYYFKVIRAMWWADPAKAAPVTLPTISKVCVAILTIATLIFGVWSNPILALLK